MPTPHAPRPTPTAATTPHARTRAHTRAQTEPTSEPQPYMPPCTCPTRLPPLTCPPHLEQARGRILGPAGQYMKHIEANSGTRLQLVGKGSNTNDATEAEGPLCIRITAVTLYP